MAFDANRTNDTDITKTIRTKTITLEDGTMVSGVFTEPYKLNAVQKPVIAWRKEDPKSAEFVLEVKPWARARGVDQSTFSKMITGSEKLNHANGWQGRFVLDTEMGTFNLIPLPEGHFKCSYCEEHLPISVAKKAKAQASGIASVCTPCQNERDQLPSGRAAKFLQNTARRIRSNLGLTGSPSQLMKEMFDVDISFGSPLHSAITDLIKEGDRFYGRDERGHALYQLDHGVPVAIAPHFAFNLNNIRPMPIERHKVKTKTDVTNIDIARETEEAKAAAEKVFKKVNKYCRSVPTSHWHPMVFGLAEEWSDMESLIADADEANEVTEMPTSVPPLPTTEEITLAQGIIRDTEVPPQRDRSGPYVSPRERATSRRARAVGAKFWAKSPARIVVTHGC